MKKLLNSSIVILIIFIILACTLGNQAPVPLSSSPVSFSRPTALPDGMTRAGGPPPLPAAIAITSHDSYTSAADLNNFLSKNVNANPGALDVLNWARDKGYYPQASQADEAVKVTFSNGLTTYLVDFSGKGVQPIAFLRFVTPEGKSMAMMGRMEGDKDNPALVLFSRDGQVRFTKDGIKINQAWNDGGILPVKKKK